jgi:hypothetical protein
VQSARVRSGGTSPCERSTRMTVVGDLFGRLSCNAIGDGRSSRLRSTVPKRNKKITVLKIRPAVRAGLQAVELRKQGSGDRGLSKGEMPSGMELGPADPQQQIDFFVEPTSEAIGELLACALSKAAPAELRPDRRFSSGVQRDDTAPRAAETPETGERSRGQDSARCVGARRKADRSVHAHDRGDRMKRRTTGSPRTGFRTWRPKGPPAEKWPDRFRGPRGLARPLHGKHQSSRREELELKSPE